ncbi:tetratricopeptide repeat protein [Qipengyuania vesicularis]|uniref:tetratricopeptide repeat protein n=1 Tax=Qipengyuania vesicularis TaxID=2867232 RepID=UPI001C8702D4|nr:tetratricopeptide repeat protein [Qipengyuania vesicularis]MBX7526466.1 tetratricopeptide repeat protein [Qipengyuania vesicularis]
MSWLPIIAIAVLSFLAAILLLRVRKGGWTLLGATLLFGLTGYALQGSPDQPSSPGQAEQQQAVDGELLIEARREFFDTSQFPSRWIVTGDSYMRRGDFDAAAGFYRNAIEEAPGDIEAWLGLGIALVEHAEGNLTPAALHAFERAQELDETNGGPRYFLGLSWLRAREIDRTLELWREALAAAPDDAPWRESLALRLGALETMLEAAQASE